jgi:hypothetical protein
MSAVCGEFGVCVVPANGMASGQHGHLVTAPVTAATEHPQVAAVQDPAGRQAPLGDVVDVERSFPGAAVLTGEIALGSEPVAQELMACSLPGPTTLADLVQRLAAAERPCWAWERFVPAEPTVPNSPIVSGGYGCEWTLTRALTTAPIHTPILRLDRACVKEAQPRAQASP